MWNKKHLVIAIIGAVAVWLQACNSGPKTLEADPITPESTMNPVQLWPDNGESKEFKVDSSEFRIYASKKDWQIGLERASSFEDQLGKIKRALVAISQEANLRELRMVEIQPLNDDLLSDIAAVPEIPAELIQRKGKVNSMKTVSPHAHQSEYLNEITALFQPSELEPVDYYIDKCRGEEVSEDSTFYTLRCGTIAFKLKEVVPKNQ